MCKLTVYLFHDTFMKFMLYNHGSLLLYCLSKEYSVKHFIYQEAAL